MAIDYLIFPASYSFIIFSPIPLLPFHTSNRLRVNLILTDVVFSEIPELHIFLTYSRSNESMYTHTVCIFLSAADSGFVVLQGTTYWTDLFVRHFLFQAEHTIDGDDLLFFVRKKHVKTSSRYLPKFETEVDVFRKDSKKLPIGDPDIDWEETVYLNLVVHQFDYTLTLAICTRTSPKELQVRIFFRYFSLFTNDKLIQL